MEILKQSDAMTRLAICAVLATGAVYAGEKLCAGKHFPLWEKYGPWITANRVQAIAILAAVLYALITALTAQGETEKQAPEGGFEPVEEK